MSKFWLSVLIELNQCGIKDIFIAYVEGLMGFPEAINTVFPNRDASLIQPNLLKIHLCISYNQSLSKFLMWIVVHHLL
ncbi:transposase [Legionella londiniensis]|uniref:transposase n=1 Tax=Legionella londiniensis TaxID=45068 RepID=UPI00399D254D